MCIMRTSKPPMNAPTRTETKITSNVNLMVSSRVGHVTFLSSAATSLKNCIGPIFGIFGAAFVCIETLFSYQKPLPGLSIRYSIKNKSFCKDPSCILNTQLIVSIRSKITCYLCSSLSCIDYDRMVLYSCNISKKLSKRFFSAGTRN